MKTLLKSVLAGAGFAIGLLLVFYIWGQIHKALPPNRNIPNHEARRVVGKNVDPLAEFLSCLKTYAPELVVTRMTRSENNELIAKFQGNAALAEGASIVIPDPETKNLREVACNIKMVIKLSGEEKSAPIKELKVLTEKNISVVYANGFVSVDKPTDSPVTYDHIVYPGETIDDIARHYGVSVEDIKTVNEISDNDSIQVGSKLIIPR